MEFLRTSKKLANLLDLFVSFLKRIRDYVKYLKRWHRYDCDNKLTFVQAIKLCWLYSSWGY